MPNEPKTIEELLIELDAADTQLSNEAALVIRKLTEMLANSELVLDEYKFELRKAWKKNEELENSK